WRVMLGRIEKHQPRTDALDPALEVRVTRGEHGGAPVKQICIRFLHPARLLACQRMAAPESFVPERPCADDRYDAPRVGDQRVGIRPLASLDDSGDRLRKTEH